VNDSHFLSELGAAASGADRFLGHLEGDVTTVVDNLRADLDQLLLQARQRPVLDRLGCRQRAEKVAKVVGECVRPCELPVDRGRSSPFSSTQRGGFAVELRTLMEKLRVTPFLRTPRREDW